MRLRRSVIAASVALTAAAALASTAPPGTLSLVPNTAGHASKLVIDASLGGNAQSNAQVQSVVLSGTRGLRFDPRSRRARCTSQQASNFGCPAASRIGTGQAQGHASGALVPGGRYDFTASIQAFLAPPQQSGDLAGVVLQFNEPKSGQRGSTTGRVVPVASGPFGIQLRFDDLGGAMPPPPGVTITIDRLQMTSGAKRRVVRSRTVRRHGRRVRVRRRITYSLLTNPRTCGGSWPYQLVVTYSDHQQVYDGSAPCSR